LQIHEASVNLGVKAETATQIQRWDYDVFGESVQQLKMLAIDCFEDRGLFTRFSINIDVFLSFADDIVAGYNDCTYVGERSLARSEATSRSNTRRGNH